MRYKSLLLAPLLALCASLGCSCKDDAIQPQPNHTPITLHAAFTSTRWVKLEWNNDSSAVSRSYLLLRNGHDTVFAGTKAGDTATVIDSGIVPSTGYSYSLYRIYDSKHWDSASLSLRTLDTTKDDYTWETIRLGLPGSVLYGVWGLSPQSVWMAGRIDTGEMSVGVAHLHDGQIDYMLLEGVGTYNACYGLSDSSVYFVGQGTVAHYDGHAFDYHVFNGDSLPDFAAIYFNAVWVTPDDREVFAVGNGGTIIHRTSDGKTWEKMESGTTLAFTSILGFSNHDIYASGLGATTGIVVHYDGTSWQPVVRGDPHPPDSTYLKGAFTCLSGSSGDSLVVVGQGVHHRYGTQWQEREPTNLGQLAYMQGVEARRWNDIFVVGDFGLIMHWNGDRWRLYSQFLDYTSDMILNSVFVLEGESFIIGSDHNNAVLIHGR